MIKFAQLSFDEVLEIGPIAGSVVHSWEHIAIIFNEMNNNVVFEKGLEDNIKEIGLGTYQLDIIPTDIVDFAGKLNNPQLILCGNFLSVEDKKYMKFIIDNGGLLADHGTVVATLGFGSHEITFVTNDGNALNHVNKYIKEMYGSIYKNRTTWFKWLREAEHVDHPTGTLFKFPNGLSVKMDDAEESFASLNDNDRIYCETYVDGETERFANEEDFLIWLTKYF